MTCSINREEYQMIRGVIFQTPGGHYIHDDMRPLVKDAFGSSIGPRTKPDDALLFLPSRMAVAIRDILQDAADRDHDPAVRQLANRLHQEAIF